MNSTTTFTRIALIGSLLALIVIMFGGYVRLSNAGLSCPDWPGCYGKALVPETTAAIATANEAFPERPVDVSRAWLEMIHRYLAAILGVVIMYLAVVAWLKRRAPDQLVAVPVTLLALVIFQGLLGMWTVTLLLKPIVVTAHLLGGLTTLALLWWLALRQGRLFLPAVGHRSLDGPSRVVRPRYVLFALALLYAQISVGGWTSTNYAALACPDFPTCQGEWLPALDFAAALKPWHGLGKNYEGGILDNQARVTIHMLHRMGAVLVALYFTWLGIQLLRSGVRALATAGALMLGVLAAQISLGISNVVLHLPLNVAVAHNGVAALLLLATLSVYHIARPPDSHSA